MTNLLDTMICGFSKLKENEFLAKYDFELINNGDKFTIFSIFYKEYSKKLFRKFMLYFL
jgi:hypothetical protein